MNAGHNIARCPRSALHDEMRSIINEAHFVCSSASLDLMGKKSEKIYMTLVRDDCSYYKILHLLVKLEANS